MGGNNLLKKALFGDQTIPLRTRTKMPSCGVCLSQADAQRLGIRYTNSLNSSEFLSNSSAKASLLRGRTKMWSRRLWRRISWMLVARFVRLPLKDSAMVVVQLQYLPVSDSRHRDSGPVGGTVSGTVQGSGLPRIRCARISFAKDQVCQGSGVQWSGMQGSGMPRTFSPGLGLCSPVLSLVYLYLNKILAFRMLFWIQTMMNLSLTD